MFDKKLIALLLFLILIVALCWPTGEVEVDDLTDAVIVECPHDYRWDEKEVSKIEEFTGGRDNIPEFNDCQRFVVGSETAPTYDSLFAIFASGSLDTMHAEPPSEAAEAQRFGRASAIIRAWGNYADLGLERGFSCLILQVVDGRWRASIVPAKPGADCTGALEVANSAPLDVVREPAPRDLAGGGAVPPVARWAFDSRLWKQYIVIKCGDGTCYVGPRDFEPRPLADELSAMGVSSPGGAPYRIAGWHDVQYLAGPPAAGSSRPVDPPILGVAIPDESLGGRTVAEYRNNWLPVARVALSGPSDHYATKLNFTAAAGGALNSVEACLDDGAGSCPGLPSMKAACANADGISAGAWRTRHINAAASDTTYHCVEYRVLGSSDAGLEVPGTARWRWVADDETLWIRCPQGCCKIVP